MMLKGSLLHSLKLVLLYTKLIQAFMVVLVTCVVEHIKHKLNSIMYIYKLKLTEFTLELISLNEKCVTISTFHLIHYT